MDPNNPCMRKNKTVAAWLAFWAARWACTASTCTAWATAGWLLPIPTALGLYGIQRVQQLGQDDQLSWVLIPLLGFTIAGCALKAILYGLATPERWNALHNPSAAPDAAPGRTGWPTIFAIAAALMVGPPC
jgi:hypothetical protein